MPNLFVLTHDEAHVGLRFANPMQALGSTVLGGGYGEARSLLNLKVPHHSCGNAGTFPDPEYTLRKEAAQRGLPDPVVGMMTAAWMSSLRMQTCSFGEGDVTSVITAGVSNAKRAGEAAEYFPHLNEDLALPAGTINIALLFTIPLSPAAMVEAVMVGTEAKGAALAELDIRNPVSGALATGTGTDSIVVFAPKKPTAPTLRYCGKHVSAGEALAKATIGALTQSLATIKQGDSSHE